MPTGGATGETVAEGGEGQGEQRQGTHDPQREEGWRGMPRGTLLGSGEGMIEY